MVILPVFLQITYKRQGEALSTTCTAGFRSLPYSTGCTNTEAVIQVLMPQISCTDKDSTRTRLGGIKSTRHRQFYPQWPPGDTQTPFFSPMEQFPWRKIFLQGWVKGVIAQWGNAEIM